MISFETNPKETQFRLLKDRYDKARELFGKVIMLMNDVPTPTERLQALRSEIEEYQKVDPQLP
jgi:Plant phosphoribosyltransferase C-terminal